MASFSRFTEIKSKVKTAYLTDHTTEPMSAEQAKQMTDYQKWTAPLDSKDYNYNYPLMVKN